jgi:hypothetical protein
LVVDGARSVADTQGVLGELCDRLLHCGIPIWRVGLFLLTLHPEIMGQRLLWKEGSAVDVSSAPFEAFQSADFRNSPVRRVIGTGISVRRRLGDRHCPELSTPSEQGAPGVHFGVALHLGQVSYGNIGSRNRLKFACVGPAMNLAARIEALTKKVDRTTLASDEFARRCPSEFAPIGEFDFAGFASARTVFGLNDESSGVAYPAPAATCIIVQLPPSTV